MRFLSGVIIVLASVLGGFLVVGGHLQVLFQPAEFIIILGTSAGSFIIANSGKILSRIKHALKEAREGDNTKKEEFLSLLQLLFKIFKISKTKGLLSLENHIDSPFESDIFQSFPEIFNKKEVIVFISDYLRIMTMGCDSSLQIESLMDQEIETIEEEHYTLTGALQTLADATPAIGIVAAVLGVIHTMGSIDQPPAVLGKLIGGALVGTFLGVLVAYGFIGPLASSLKQSQTANLQFYKVVKACFISYLNGVAPIISVEFARKNIDSHLRPSFQELETATQEI